MKLRKRTQRFQVAIALQLPAVREAEEDCLLQPIECFLLLPALGANARHVVMPIGVFREYLRRCPCRHLCRLQIALTR